jgi:hypothetical protein
MTALAALLAVAAAASAAAQAASEEEAAEVLAAIRLPASAQALRERGVPAEEVGAAVREAKERHVRATDAQGALAASAEAVESHGPIENFGTFIRAQLAAGLRGRELAAAIRAEHRARGIGKGRRLMRAAEIGEEDRRRGAGERAGGAKPEIEGHGRRPEAGTAPAQPDSSGKRRGGGRAPEGRGGSRGGGR